MPVVAAPALGGPNAGPARRAVDGAGVSRGLDEHGRDVVALGPVLGQAAAHEGEDVRAEVGATQGNIRNLGLSTTSGRFFSRFSGVHRMKLSRGASFQAAVEKPSMAMGQPFRSCTA